MAFTPYLNFDGQTREALTFYADLFGADELRLLPFSDAPSDQNMPQSDRIMYGHIMVGDNCLMASDYPPGMEAKLQESVSVNWSASSVEEGRRLFDALTDGGTVKMPFGPVFFSPGFGMLRDKFGTNWMIGVPADG